ncbi:DUF4393 domain-containing protein [Lactococcus formosensis]|nr:DUF4393 domain-containing protein [Lactococcus formosensis]MDG6151826.1 DUF4393 domain-containing protein [Lactococcus formosensis]MDG6174954.1 DUF4393 domain-containing protein [Lactococcus formosensis]
MIDFLPLIGGAIGGATSAGALKGPIKTLEELWYINFGYSTSVEADKLRKLQQQHVESYAQDIADEISKISPDNICEPSLNIIGPTLEASKFYIGDEEIRSMFAKLLASSMDQSKSNNAHSSFVEIIKQMSPLDAENLSIMNTVNSAPISQIRTKSISAGGDRIIVNNFFLDNPNAINYNEISASLENLQRLGLISISYDSYLLPIEKYDKFLENNIFLLYKQSIELANLPGNPHKDNKAISSSRGLESPTIKKGIVRTTEFGKRFCRVCII